MKKTPCLSEPVPTDDSTHPLRKWHQQYIAMDADLAEADSPLITEVQSDTLDASRVESSIEEALKTTRVTRGFCNGCRNMFDNWPNIGTKHEAHGIARHLSTWEMEAAMRKGCRCCTFILSEIDANVLDTYRKLEQRLAILDDTASASISVWNWGSVGGAQCIWVNLPGKIAKNSNFDLAQLSQFESHVVAPFANCYDEPAAQFDHVRTWLHRCIHDHKLCKSKSPVERPRRLVRIADEDIKLVLTENWSDTPCYATLSYCWGNEDFVKLTGDNLKSFLESIPKEELPKTFTDAIFIARALGLQYIWIDALCIVQGESDHSDWLNECGKMRSIYGSAHVNIAATAAADVHGGCFMKPSDYSGGFLARVSTRSYCCVRNFHSRGVYEASTSRTHLASRAWTLQERLLAPRTLYMGEQGIFWECRTTWASEFLPEGSPNKLFRKMIVPEDSPWAWKEIVQQYSKARLTNAADRLPALSGIARRQHEATGGHYIAGMWEEKLLRQLVWSCSKKGQRSGWQAPSWSWLSVDAPTRYWGWWTPAPTTVGSDEFARVLNVWTSLAGSDPFGAITDGELRMSCRALVPGHYIGTGVREGMQEIVTIDASQESFTLSMDTLDYDSTKSGETLILLPLVGGKSGLRWSIRKEAAETVKVATEEIENEEQGAQQNLLTTKKENISDERQSPTIDESELSDQKDSDSDDYETESEEMLIVGLVVSPLHNRKGVFQRVGSFEFCHRKPVRGLDLEKDQYTEFIRIMEKVGASTAASHCAEILPGSSPPEMKYVITLK